MQELKLIEYRQINRHMGWKAVANIIAKHILTKTTEPLEFTILSAIRAQDYKHASPLEQVKYRNATEFIRRVHDGMCVIIYSFDDQPEDCLACIKHLWHHHRILDCIMNYDIDGATRHAALLTIITHPVWCHWTEVVGAFPMDDEEDLDSRFY